jgi:hypothetical protein
MRPGETKVQIYWKMTIALDSLVVALKTIKTERRV